MKIEVKTEDGYEGSKRISGLVDGYEVIAISNSIAGEWKTGMSSCLPSSIEAAIAYADCFQQVFDEYEKIK